MKTYVLKVEPFTKFAEPKVFTTKAKTLDIIER